MNYFTSFLGALFLLSGFASAFVIPSTYTPTQTDLLIVQSLQPKIDTLFETKPVFANGVIAKLEAISTRFDPSSRQYYVFGEIHTIMKNKAASIQALPATTTIPAPLAIMADKITTHTNTSSEKYVQYTEASFKAALDTGQEIIINFRASWCPNCTAASNNIKANLDLLPEGVIILETDYDTSTELKAKYGVNRQTTFVFLDENGEGNKIIQNVRGIDDILESL